MDIISRSTAIQKIITGRMSDGSDRMINEILNYIVEASDKFQSAKLVFDHDPTESEIIESFANSIKTLDNNSLVQQIMDLKTQNAQAILALVLGGLM